MRSLEPADLGRINAVAPRIPIGDERLAELPVELAQFADVIERVRPQLQFETEVADFAAVLVACAEGGSLAP